MNTRPRLLWVRLATAGPRMSNKTKPPSHYETLEVNHRATQSEIKAAYFKLSKEYHPDKNPNEAATSKFQDIAEAYEVLGNFSSRKAYDRSILTHTKYGAAQPSRSKDDPKMKHYQAQAAIFRDSGKSGSTPSYDFDAWTKAHYGRTLDRTFRDRVNAARKRELRSDTDMAMSSGTGASMFGIIFSLIMLFLMVTWQRPDYDDPSLIVRKENYDSGKALQSETAQAEATTESLSTK